MITDMLQPNDGRLSIFDLIVTHGIVNLEIHRHPVGAEINFDPLITILLALRVANSGTKLKPVVRVRPPSSFLKAEHFRLHFGAVDFPTGQEELAEAGNSNGVGPR